MATAKSEAATAATNVITAFNEGGVEAALEYVDPQLEWWAPPDWLEDEVYRGHDGLRKLAAFWTDQFDEYRLHLDRLIDLDDGCVLVLSHQHGTIKGSTVEIEQPVAWIVEARDGKMSQVHIHFTWEAAADAVGVPASDLGATPPG